ncbi:hypothetical protein Tco_1095975 [Tanacetum coccineum]
MGNVPDRWEFRGNWTRCIGSPGYGVSNLLDMAYRTYWVRRIELFQYGVQRIEVSGYDVLSFIPERSFVSVGTDTPYLP